MVSERRRRPRRPGDALLTRVAFAWLAAAAIVAALAGCGGGKKETPTTTTTTNPPPAEPTSFRVYFIRDGKVQPVGRRVPHTAAVARAALAALAEGPTANERRALGVTNDVAHAPSVSITNDVARLDALPPGAASAQIVYTLTQFPGVSRVAVVARTYTRKDFEDETPQILVESPLPFQKVATPVHATGTANTFEATFQYDLIGPDGKLLKTHFVTATSGTGQRGTFDFTVPFSIDKVGPGELRVYEISAKDGSRIHEIHIPITLAK